MSKDFVYRKAYDNNIKIIIMGNGTMSTG